MANNNKDFTFQHLKIASLNIQGLRDSRKRASVFRSVKREHIDIIALQETYLMEKDLNMLKNEWEGTIHLSEGTVRSKGTVTLFSKDIDASIIQEVFTSSGRLVISSLEVGGDMLFIVNSYAPTDDRSKIDFYHQLNSVIKQNINNEYLDNIIMMGDFNCTLNNRLDIISGNYHNENTIKHFQHNIEDLNLEDCWRLFNPNIKEHTWKRRKIARRLDYLFASNSLLPFIKSCNIRSLGFSDHRAVIGDLEFYTFIRGRGSFKMNVSILEENDFSRLIENTITNTLKEYDKYTPDLRFEMLKVRIREAAQHYSIKKSKLRNDIEKKLQNQLNNIETELANDPNNEELNKSYEKVKSQYESIQMEKTKAARIRARIKWMEQGEKNTKFFMSLEKSRSTANTIFKVKLENGSTSVQEGEITEAIANFFEKLYKDEQKFKNSKFKEFIRGLNINKLTHEQKIECEKQLTEDEIYDALKGMNSGSAPGLDGLPVELYRKFWVLLKGPLLEYYNYSFSIGTLSESTQVGLITLIHKGKQLPREIIENWRPITLTNIDYKIIAKVLANRLKRVIGYLVGTHQQGFIKGRNIANVIRKIDDILDYQRAKKINDILFAVDFKQAFDRINADYIQKMLKLFDFGPVMSAWIEILFKNRTACIKNGGHISRFFEVRRGVRQGCPIAPLIFLLAVEILALKIIQSPKIKGIKLPNGEIIKILLFADDTTFLVKNLIDIREILSRLKEFSVFSGLLLNNKKSFLMFTNNKIIHGYEELNIQISSKVKILGITFSNNQTAGTLSENWNGRIKKMINLLSLWSRRQISILGKIQLIKTFGLSQFIYIMQSISIPKNVLEDINRIFFRFIWQKQFTNKNTLERVRREVMYSDKNKGGLNMVNIIDFQNSFLLDWAEKLLMSKENWTIIPKYFLEVVGGKVVFDSSVTLNMFIGIDKIKSNFWKRVLENWIQNNVSHQEKVAIKNPLYNNKLLKYKNKTIFLPSAMKLGINTIEDVWEGEKMMSYAKFINTFGPYTRSWLDYNIISNTINKHNIDINESTEAEHRISFRNNPIGSIGRKGFLTIMQDQKVKCHCMNRWKEKYNVDVDTRHWDNIFSCTKEIKMQSLLWKILHRIYPTNEILVKMKIKDSSKCDRCNDIDSLEHLFYTCEHAQKVWKHIENNIQTRLKANFKLSEEIVMLGYHNKNTEKEISRKINLILAIGKSTISKSRYRQNQNILHILDSETALRNIS